MKNNPPFALTAEKTSLEPNDLATTPATEGCARRHFLAAVGSSLASAALPVAALAAQESPAKRSPVAGRMSKSGSNPEGARGQYSAAPAWNLPDTTGKNMALSQYKGQPVVVIFNRGRSCIHCVEHLARLAANARKFSDAGIKLIAICSESLDNLRESQAEYQKDWGGFPFPLLSDAKLTVFKAYRCVDFADQPLHGTFVIDAQGWVRWLQIGSQPFNDPAFLLAEAKD